MATLVPPTLTSADSRRTAVRTPVTHTVYGSTSALPYPMLLQARARFAVRKHVTRAVARWAGLLVVDVLALSALRVALRAMRDSAVLGTALQDAANVLQPKNTLYPYEFTVAMWLGLWLAGAYGGGDNRKDGRALLVGTTLGVGLITWGRFWSAVTLHGLASTFTMYVVLSFVLCVCIAGGAMIAERLFVDRALRQVRPMSVSTVRVLAVGPADECRRALHLYVRRERACKPVGFVCTDAAPPVDAVGGLPNLVAALAMRRVDSVLLCGDLPVDVVGSVVGLADTAGCRVLAMRRLPGNTGMQAAAATLGGLPVVQLTRPSLRGGQLVVKRAFDVVLAAGGLVVLSPLLLALAGLVRATSRGRALHKQVRVGQGGKPFGMYKFRSMVAGAEKRRAELEAQNIYSDGRLFKMKDDPRITAVGRVLRACSLDELPQLWNVLRGDMSLVGPRPPLFTELAVYDDHDYVRFDMKPGVTGPWQVAGRNSITDFDEVIRLETEYMRGWSPWRDVSILLRTVPVVLGRAGAL